jgi:hypothetical protein
VNLKTEEERPPAHNREYGLQSQKNGKATCLKGKKFLTTETTESAEAPKRGKERNFSVFYAASRGLCALGDLCG